MTQMNLSTKQKQTHEAENRLVIAKKSSGGGMNWDFDVQLNSVQLLSCVRLFATP